MIECILIVKPNRALFWDQNSAPEDMELFGVVCFDDNSGRENNRADQDRFQFEYIWSGQIFDDDEHRELRTIDIHSMEILYGLVSPTTNEFDQ